MATILGLLFLFYFFAAVINLIPIVFKALRYVFRKIFLSKRFLDSMLWVVAAFVASWFTFRALGRQFLTGENAKLLIAEHLPPRENLRGRAMSLLAIELMLELRKSYGALKD